MTNANLSKQLTELEDTVEQHRRLKKKKDEEWRDRARKYELEVPTCMHVFVSCNVLESYVLVTAARVFYSLTMRPSSPTSPPPTTESTTNN